MTFSCNFWFLNGYRLTPYLKLMVVSNWPPPPICEFHIAVQWVLSKQNDVNIAKPSIHKAAVSGINEMIFPSFSWTYLDMLVYYSSTRAWQIVCAVYGNYANLFLYAKKFKSISIYVSLFPHCISLFLNWVPLVLLVFFTTHLNNCFVFWNVFHYRDTKTPCTTLHQITHDRYFT